MRAHSLSKLVKCAQDAHQFLVIVSQKGDELPSGGLHPVVVTGDRVGALWEQKSEEDKNIVLSAIPLGRLSTPEEVAAAVVFLASDESSYITGITLDVCGGRYLR